MWRRTRVRGYEGIYLIYVSVFTCVMWWVVFWVRHTKSWKEKCVPIRTISCLHCGLAEDLNFDLLFLLCFPVEDLRRGGVLAPVERPCLVAATDLSPWVYRGGTVSRFFFFVSPFSARGCSGRRKEGVWLSDLLRWVVCVSVSALVFWASLYARALRFFVFIWLCSARACNIVLKPSPTLACGLWLWFADSVF